MALKLVNGSRSIQTGRSQVALHNFAGPGRPPKPVGVCIYNNDNIQNRFEGPVDPTGVITDAFESCIENRGVFCPEECGALLLKEVSIRVIN